jgi:2-dehydro-3-deoxygluconokinase
MRVLTFGEILLRLSSPGHTKLLQKDSLDATFCGSEVNVAVSLSKFGVDSKFLTKLPNSDIGDAAVNSIRYFGVDADKVIYGNGRMGLFYLEKGASQRPSKVIYDREYSAIAEANPDEFNWKTIFQHVDWFHFSGITPALSDSMIKTCFDACKYAHNAGITISCDLNFRAKLWSSEKAQQTMKELVKYVDVCIANEEDADKVLGIKAANSNVNTGQIDKAKYQVVAKEIVKKYECKYVAISLRESHSASDNGWSGMLYNSSIEECCFSKNYEIRLVDRLGGGDSFAAGIIFGLASKMTTQDTIEFSVAASCLKQTMEGDYNRTSVDEVLNLVNSDGTGRIQR